MKEILSFVYTVILLIFMVGCSKGSPKSRLIVLTDIGGDPDDQQSMVRLMLYSNEFNIEGLIASASGTPGELVDNVVKPHLIREIVKAYGQVRPNLLLHKRGYPTVEYLLERIKSGNPQRGLENIGEGKDTQGSDWIISIVDKPDPNPLNIAIWGGSTELAQALWRVRNSRSEQEIQKFLSKIRVYDIGHQDNTGPWINQNFPELFYVLNKAPDGVDKREAVFRGMYLGGDESLTSREWLDTHVRNDHGPLGKLYPDKTWTAPNPHGALKEGDTPSWFFFLKNGLNDPEHPEYGGWSGRFELVSGKLYRDAADSVDGVFHPRVTVWRWRQDFQNDFEARMDWCVKTLQEANHNPKAKVNQPLSVKSKAGEIVKLDASGSYDPDDQMLQYQWVVYPECGTITSEIRIENRFEKEASVYIPEVTKPGVFHVILKITDTGIPPLCDYKRIIFEVEPKL